MNLILEQLGQIAAWVGWFFFFAAIVFVLDRQVRERKRDERDDS